MTLQALQEKALQELRQENEAMREVVDISRKVSEGWSKNYSNAGELFDALDDALARLDEIRGKEWSCKECVHDWDRETGPCRECGINDHPCPKDCAPK